MSAPITGTTTILGLIADPVIQARAPEMANRLLEDREQFGKFVLVPMRVAAVGLTDFVAGLRHLQNFTGAVVSMPHKTAMFKLVDELTPEAKLVGAVNAIRREPDGRLVGTALDGEGFVGGLKDAGYGVAGKSCLLAGAGGAASAIAFALAKHGCSALYVINRTHTKAAALAARVRDAYPHVPVTTDIPTTVQFDIAINGTSLGMNDDDELPIPLDVLSRVALVAECVVAPEITRLLQRAQRAELSIHTGIPMLAAQMDMMLEFMGVPHVVARHEPD
ncbi:MAG: shikimate dehydrogenase [Candidatus Obscuribacterales bacterium]|nr:shikimate dehydrogenase [Steroidobacteraceae bacterium]